MKYIDAERLRAEINRKIKVNTEYGKLNLTDRARIGNHAQTLALQDILSVLDSLQQEPLIHTELCNLIACDVIQATAKRAIEKPQDKDKEEDLMIKKMEYLNMLEKSFFQQEQPEVDLEKEISRWMVEECGPSDFNPYADHWCADDVVATARHFYELGLNARKENKHERD